MRINLISQIFILIVLREFFLLIPNEYLVVPGIIRAYDLGIILCFLYIIGSIVINPRKFRLLSNSFSYYLIAFLAIVVFSPFVSLNNYDQPYIVGIRAIRGSFFYIYFFVLLCGIDSPSKLSIYVKYLKIVACCLTLAIFSQNFLNVNVFSPDIQLDIARLGMSRMLNPGLDIITLVFFILLGNFICRKKSAGIIDNAFLLLFSLQILLSLTRAVIFGCFLTIVATFFISKEYKNVIKACFAGGMLISFYLFVKLTLGLQSDFGLGIISDLYHLSYNEITNVKGNVGIRFLLAQTYLQFGFEHWFWGTGYISPIGSVAKILKYPILRQDLGYIIMFSQYGLISLIWLMGISISFFKKGLFLLRHSAIGEYRGIVLGLIANFIFMLVSFITLPHFIDPNRICVVAINLALLQAVYSIANLKE